MSAETTGIPLVVRYNNRGQPDGLKEELNIIVNSVSANEYKGGNISATSIPHVSSIEDVSITGTIQTGHVIAWDTTGWVNVPQTGGPGSTTFTGLDDTPDIYPDPGDDPPDPILRYSPDGVEGGPGIIYSQYGEADLVNFNSIYNNYKPGGASSNEVTSIRYDLTTFDLLKYEIGGYPFLDINDIPVDNDIIKFESGKWKLVSEGATAPGTPDFKDLPDVDIGAYVADRFIIVKSTPAATGVEMSNFTAGEILQVSSDVYTVSSDLDTLETTVTNLTLSGNLSDVSVTGPITQNPSYLKWDSGSSKWIPAGLDLSQSDVVDLTDVDDNLTTSNNEKILAIQNNTISATQYNLTDLSRFRQIHAEITGAPADSFLTTGSDPNILGSVLKSDFVTTAINSYLSSYASDLSSYISANESTWATDTDTTDHSLLSNRNDANAHPQYVLSATNQELSGLVTNIETSTVSLSGYIAANQSSWSEKTTALASLTTDVQLANLDKYNVLAYDLINATWKNYAIDGITTNPKFSESSPTGSGLPELIIHVSGLGTSGFTQRDLLAVGPSGTLVPVSSLLPSINPVPLFEDIGKLIIINESATDLIESSAMKWDYTSQGLQVLGDVSAQNYYGNITGATGEISNISGVSSIQFDINMPPEYTAVEGEVYYDSDAHTLSIKTSADTTLQVGQEQVIRVRNGTGTTINNGEVVYLSGVQGTGASKLLVGKATASTSEEIQDIIGIATQQILDGHDGFITTFGIVNDVDTAAYPVGTILYLSTSAGLYTSAAPPAPNHSIRLGIVLRQSSTAGSIFAHIDPGYDIADLHDVSVQGVQTGDLLRWNGTIFAPSAYDHGTLAGLADDDHDQYVFKAPEGADRNVIQPVDDVPALILQESISQTQPLLILKNALTTTTMTVDGDGNIDTAGTLTAQSKSFLIDHPTKEGMKLQYTCLEGPENGVYCRGRVKTNVIVLPDYWVGLVDENTITVNLTPAGKRQPDLFVEDIRDNKIILSSSASIDCFYTVYAERKDIEKLIVEF